MRVITGKAKGKPLRTLPGLETRPTSQRVKEGLFSAIQFDIEGRRVLDLFAGSGALGIEALSRGAAHCVFVDQSPEAVAMIRQNLQSTGLAAQSQVICREASAFLAHTRGEQPFDLVFLDPPYQYPQLLSILTQVSARVPKGGIVTCETSAQQQLPETIENLTLYRTYRYGNVQIWVYHSQGV